MNKVSFDFDSTLSRKDIQEYAKYLIDNKIADVWICTSRLPPETAPNKEWNNDLFKVADELNISRDKVIFTSYNNKSEFLNNKGFKWHIDDDNIELSFIKTDTDVKPVYLFGNKNWRNDCEKYLIK